MAENSVSRTLYFSGLGPKSLLYVLSKYIMKIVFADMIFSRFCLNPRKYHVHENVLSYSILTLANSNLFSKHTKARGRKSLNSRKVASRNVVPTDSSDQKKVNTVPLSTCNFLSIKYIFALKTSKKSVDRRRCGRFGRFDENPPKNRYYRKKCGRLAALVYIQKVGI